jgi:O-acetylhomoserine/O-acetylserine sulfhydrylase-like pyridoxal-dependent enzyme
MDVDVSFVDYSHHLLWETPVFKNVKKIYLFQDLPNVESVVQDTANILEAGVKNQVQFIIKSSFIGTEKWHRYTGNVLPCFFV